MQNELFVITAEEAKNITKNCFGKTKDETASEMLESVYNRIREAASHGYEAIKFTTSGDLDNGLLMAGVVQSLSENGFSIEKRSGNKGYLVSWQ